MLSLWMKSVVASWMLASATVALANTPAILARDAKDVLKRRCYTCHGANQTRSGGMDYVIQLNKLLDNRLVAPGRAADSPLIKRIKSDRPMPPPDSGFPPVSAADLRMLEEWINAGAHVPVETPRPFLDDRAVYSAAIVDAEEVRRVNPPDVAFIRYLTFANLYNTGVPEAELDTYRDALSQLVNSLSRQRSIQRPQSLDAARTLYRIDLRHYGWTKETWETITREYPYGVVPNFNGVSVLQEMTGTKLPLMRADWFANATSRPPLYHDILALPTTEAQLLNNLGVNVAENLRTSSTLNRRVLRAGFQGSGIAHFNRVIERHEMSHGALWKTYDFRAGSDERNVFSRPLGPIVDGFGTITGGEDLRFRHDAGEIIFNLPNGLQGYYLNNGAGQLIGVGEIDIVQDRQRNETVTLGISCMRCHADGIKRKENHALASIERRPQSFSAEALRSIRNVYAPQPELDQKFAADATLFINAVKQASYSDPAQKRLADIPALVDKFRADVDLAAAAAELGITPQELERVVGNLEVGLQRQLGNLFTGGYLSRDVFKDLFKRVALGLNLGVEIALKQLFIRVKPYAANARRAVRGGDWRVEWESSPEIREVDLLCHLLQSGGTPFLVPRVFPIADRVQNQGRYDLSLVGGRGGYGPLDPCRDGAYYSYLTSHKIEVRQTGAPTVHDFTTEFNVTYP